MADYCKNELRITGPKADLDQFRADAASFERAWDPEDATTEPHPCLLNFEPGSPYPKEGEGGFELRGKNDNWYDWRIKNWGTKWNAMDVDVNVTDIGITYNFTTAYSPPLEWLMEATERYPTLKFMLAYFEGTHDFCGVRIVEDGNMFLDHQAKAWDHDEMVDDSDWFEQQQDNFWDNAEDMAKKEGMSFPSAPVPPGTSPF